MMTGDRREGSRARMQGKKKEGEERKKERQEGGGGDNRQNYFNKPRA